MSNKLKPEQEKIIKHGKGNIIVSASAGSGKTFVMIERLMRLITEEGVSLDKILAVTFTERAAQEMKEKITSKLFEKVEEGKENLKEEILKVQTADISTIHAFCYKIVKNYFFELSIPADSKIMEESDALAMQKEVLDDLFEELYENNESWFLELLDTFIKKRSDKSLKESIIKINNFLKSEERFDFLIEKSSQVYSKESFKIIYDLQIKNFKTNLTEYAKGYNKIASELPEKLEKEKLQMIEESDFISSLAKVEIDKIKTVFLDYKNMRFPSKKSSYDLHEIGLCQKCKDIRKQLKEYVEKELKYLSRDYSSLETEFLANKSLVLNLLKVVQMFNSGYQTEKVKNSLLDFNDLEHYTLKALESNEILNAIKERYEYILVDEYQDVNGVQEAIIQKISNNNLFLVGDSKQSIYSFRGCNPKLFDEKTKLYKESKNDVFEKLNHNFRSQKNILDFVNEVFSFSMTEGIGSIDYKEISTLQEGGVYAQNSTGGAVLHCVEDKKEEVVAEGIYDILTDDIKKQKSIKQEVLIKNIILNSLNKEYYDIRTKEIKKIEYQDITILLRSIDAEKLLKLIQVLEESGIPIIAPSKENLIDYTEVQVVINLIKYLNKTKNDIPLAIVLKEFFNFSNFDLITIRNFGKREYTFETCVNEYIKKGEGTLCERLKSFEKYIIEKRYKLDYVPVVNVLNEIINETNYYEKLLLTPMGEEKVKRVKSLLLEGYRGTERLYIKEFLKKIELSGENFSVPERSVKNAVRIETMHASKGLEYPIVIIPYLEKSFNFTDSREEIIFDREYGFAIKSYDKEKLIAKENLFRHFIKEKKKKEQVLDELRVFYVALTRAKVKLHLITTQTNEFNIVGGIDLLNAKRAIDFIPASIQAINESVEESSTFENQERSLILDGATCEIKNELLKNLEYKYHNIFGTTLPLKTSVTNLNTEEENKSYQIVSDKEDLITNIESGVIAHKIMQNVDFESNFESEIERLQKCNILLNGDAQKVNLQNLQSAISHPYIQSLKGFKLYKEKEFIVSIKANEIYKTTCTDSLLVQGVIDLLAIKGDSAYIIDYKYSKKSKQALIERYQKQLDIYAIAVERVLNKTVKGKVILNLISGEVIEL